MNPLTIAQFRADFPEFSDPSKYPDSTVTLWLGVAMFQVANAQRWGTLLPTVQELVTAHYVALAARDLATLTSGLAPGAPIGLQSSKSVADVSVSYDYSALLNTDAGFWNSTTYGQRYWMLARMAGAGPVHLPNCNTTTYY